jgi:hypothetical protein
MELLRKKIKKENYFCRLMIRNKEKKTGGKAWLRKLQQKQTKKTKTNKKAKCWHTSKTSVSKLMKSCSTTSLLHK